MGRYLSPPFQRLGLVAATPAGTLCFDSQLPRKVVEALIPHRSNHCVGLCEPTRFAGSLSPRVLFRQTYFRQTYPSIPYGSHPSRITVMSAHSRSRQIASSGQSRFPLPCPVIVGHGLVNLGCLDAEKWCDLILRCGRLVFATNPCSAFAHAAV
jgi:hypothetical protein